MDGIKERKTDRQTDRQTDRKKDRKKERQTERKKDRSNEVKKKKIKRKEWRSKCNKYLIKGWRYLKLFYQFYDLSIFETSLLSKPILLLEMFIYLALMY